MGDTKVISERHADKWIGDEWCRVTVRLTDSGKGPELSVTGMVGVKGRGRDYVPGLGNCESRGQCTEAAERFFPGLARTWGRWHLNGLRPECSHQSAAGWEVAGRESVTIYHWTLRPEIAKERRDLCAAAERRYRAGHAVPAPTPEEARMLALPSDRTTDTDAPPVSTNTDGELTVEYVARTRAWGQGPTESRQLGWLRPEEHPRGILGKACPTCGYRYGHAWLYEPLPDSVVEWAKAWDGTALPDWAEGGAL